jgi:hypothetical protein
MIPSTPFGRPQSFGVIMGDQKEEQFLPEPRRREVFRLLVTAQDLEMTVAESRRMVADTCGLNQGQVMQIEREGLEAGWPPL